MGTPKTMVQEYLVLYLSPRFASEREVNNYDLNGVGQAPIFGTPMRAMTLPGHG